MTASAHPVKSLTQTDTDTPDDHGLVDMREGGSARAGSFVYVGNRLATGWHSHDFHQIEFALEGVVEVETDAARYLLPSQQAAWIPAGLRHETTIETAVKTVSVFFDPSLVPNAGDRARILAVPPLIREMMLFAERWPIERRETDAAAELFFAVLGRLVGEALDEEAPLSLPRTDHPLLRRATAYLHDHLEKVTIAEVSRLVGASERTLRRLFATELDTTWRRYLLQARLLRSMALLADDRYPVIQVASAVGFDSASSFSRAFQRWCGESPSTYRRRVAGVGTDPTRAGPTPGGIGARRR